MFGIAVVPSVLLALGMAISPESPRWLVQVFPAILWYLLLWKQYIHVTIKLMGKKILLNTSKAFFLFIYQILCHKPNHGTVSYGDNLANNPTRLKHIKGEIILCFKYT